MQAQANTFLSDITCNGDLYLAGGRLVRALVLAAIAGLMIITSQYLLAYYDLRLAFKSIVSSRLVKHGMVLGSLGVVMSSISFHMINALSF